MAQRITLSGNSYFWRTAWHWQDGGTVQVGAEAKIALHDLTGFEGRCDAVLFSKDADFTPPNEYYALARNWKPDRVNYDQMLAAAKAAGFTYAVMVTKHHDGFTLWPSESGDLGTKSTFGGRDFVKEFLEAGRKQGLKVGLYYSPPDWWFDRRYKNFAYRDGPLDMDHKSVNLSPRPKDHAATPIVQGSRVFISSGYGAGCALIDVSATPPKTIWKNKKMRNHFSTCVLWKEHLYGFDETTLKCLDFATGEVKWQEKKYAKGTLMAADGRLLVYSQRGQLGLVEATPASYQELAFIQAIKVREDYPGKAEKQTWAVPVLANGRIFCRSQDDLVCLDLH